MAHAPPQCHDALRANWRTIQETSRKRVCRKRAAPSHSAWIYWAAFCESLRIDPHQLPPDPVPLLQVFARQLRTGALSASSTPIRSRTVEDILRGVGQAYAGLGALDPQMIAGKLDFR